MTGCILEAILKWLKLMGNQKEVCRVLIGIVLATYGLFDESMFFDKIKHLESVAGDIPEIIRTHPYTGKLIERLGGKC